MEFWDLYIFLIFSLCPAITETQQCPNSNLDIRGGKYILSNDGNIVEYICPDGFYPSPNKILACRFGSWSPENNKRPECKKVSCPNPRVLKNGVVEPYKRIFYVNDTTTYECDSGYTFRGSATRTCQKNGKWSGTTPICSYDSDHCPDPGIPPGTSRNGHNFNIGDKVVFKCDRNLKLVGSKERECQIDGSWSGKNPECYAEFTYDTPEEIAEAFGKSLKTTLSMYDETGNVPKHIRVAHNGPLDIYIALDISDSIKEDEFKKAKDVTIKLIEKISDFDATPNYEIIMFATDIMKIPGDDLESLINNLKDFQLAGKHKKTGTNIAKAYEHISKNMRFKEANNITKFLETQHIVIMFTDGVYNMGGAPKRYVDEIKDLVFRGDEARNQFLDLYLFGVRASVVRSDVEQWVTNKKNEQHLFLAEDYKEVEKTLDAIIDEGNRVGLCGLHRRYGDSDSSSDSDLRPMYPWLFKVFVTRTGTQGTCLGSLVTPKFILTAAHCFKKDDGENIQVESPSHQELFEVQNYIPHPLYDHTQSKEINETYLYDIALIELKKEIAPSIYVRPICIPCTEETTSALQLTGNHITCKHHKERVLVGKEVETFFWSKTKEQAFFTNKSTHIKVGENEINKCIEMTQKTFNIDKKIASKYITNNFFCTGGMTSNNIDEVSCKGDSGGALFLKRNRLVQVGIVSWGLQDLCLQSGKTDKTRDFHIDLFNPEIQTFLKEHLSDEKRGAPLHFIE